MPWARRPSTPVFATVPYEPDERGFLRAVVPSRCPFAAPGEPGCHVAVRHRRDRKTGPCFPIAVVQCSAHPLHSFTLYPPGHFPYGRRPLVSSSVSGPLLLDPATKQPTWAGTVLQAAADAAEAVRWAPHSVTEAPAVRRTQGRHLDLAGLLLGVHPELDDGDRERIATRLRVPTMVVRAAASMWPVSWTTRGAANVLVLAAVSVDGSLLDRLVSAGYAAGLWARPRRWAPPRSWVLARSGTPEPAAPSDSRCRAPPATTSRGAPSGAPGSPSDP